MESILESYRQYLRKKGLKSTRQRERIAEEFFKKHQHLTVDELLAKVRRLDPTIGYATVYRTLKILTEMGLASKREFGGGRARFEQGTSHHHDHLICLHCGAIQEFVNPKIERLQETICKRHRFRLLNHKMELYGHCRRCQRSAGGDTSRGDHAHG